MARPAPLMSLLTVEAYLALEEKADVKHEFVGGQIYAMSGASKRHNVIIGNVFSELRNAARNSACRVYVNDVKVRAAVDVIYYPDLMVACGPDLGGPLIEEAPCLVVEVLSPSTETIDRREKLLVYKRMPTLQAYLIVEQGSRQVVCHRKDEHGVWSLETFQGSHSIDLPCPKTPLSLDAIYEGTGVRVEAEGNLGPEFDGWADQGVGPEE